MQKVSLFMCDFSQAARSSIVEEMTVTTTKTKTNQTKTPRPGSYAGRSSSNSFRKDKSEHLHLGLIQGGTHPEYHDSWQILLCPVPTLMVAHLSQSSISICTISAQSRQHFLSIGFMSFYYLLRQPLATFNYQHGLPKLSLKTPLIFISAI